MYSFLQVPKCCRCLDPLAERNKTLKKNINFYEHKAKELETPVGGRPSVFVIQIPGKHKHSPNSKGLPHGQSIVLQTHSSHPGELSEYTETEFNSNYPQSSKAQPGEKIHSKSNGSSKSSAQRQNTLRQEAANSQYAPKGTYNQAYLDEESTCHHVPKVPKRSHKTKRSDNHLDNQGFYGDGDDPTPHHQPRHHEQQYDQHHHHHPQPNGYKQQPIEVHVQIVDRFVLVLGFSFC